MIYEYNMKIYLTDQERDIIWQICLDKIPKPVDENNSHTKGLINHMCHTLENAYHYKVTTMDISKGIIKLNIQKLIDLNNIVTNGMHLMLRQKQMLSWVPEKKKFKWVMNVRCIRYHLEMLIYAFKGRKIHTNEFKRNFLKIRLFKSGNNTTVEILILGLKESKKRTETRWIKTKSKILCTTSCMN